MTRILVSLDVRRLRSLPLVVLFASGALLTAPASAENQARASRTDGRIVLSVTSDAPCLLSVDDRDTHVVGADVPLKVRVMPGAHVLAASSVDDDFIERRITVTRGGNASVHLSFLPLAQARLVRARMLAGIKADADRLDAMTESDRGGAETNQRLATAIETDAQQRSQRALLKLHAIVASINALDARFKKYTGEADRLARESEALHLHASTQNTTTVTGSLTSLIGNLKAIGSDSHSRRQRILADATLRRMNRLTSLLSAASDSGFDTLPDVSEIVTIFDVTRKGIPGRLHVRDGRLLYADLASAAPQTLSAPCASIAHVKADRRGFTLETHSPKKTKTVFSPVKVASMAILGEVVLSCPELLKNFD